MDTKIRVSWPAVVVLLILVGGAVGAVALGATDLAYALGGGAVGYLAPNRGRVTP